MRAAQRRRRLLWQGLLFLLIWCNLEAWSQRRLIAEGYETTDATAVLDPYTGWRIRPHAAERAKIDACIRGLEGRGWQVNPAASSVSTDDLGRRNVVTPRDDQREIRVLCLGGSVTMGYGVAPSDGWVRVLEEMLRANLPPGERLHLLNGGLSGFSSRECAALLERVAPRYQPQIVVVMLGHNETNVYPFVSLRGGLDRMLAAVRGVLYRSPTYRYLWRAIVCRDVPASDSVPIVETSLRNLEIMRAYTSARGIHMMVVHEGRHRRYPEFYQRRGQRDLYPPSLWSQPRPGQPQRFELERRYRQFAADADVPYVDMDVSLHACIPSDDEAFSDECHLTARGNRVVAQIIAARFWELGWVPQASTAPTPAIRERERSP